ncbi:MAG: hypothetical protein OEU26_06930 [Candidatus Tectomicrobia bacterium]|nr:hypothetical protein [Candidatus Tectomicrobia bacterium]
MAHCMFVVTLDRAKADSSRAAQEQVLSYLLANGFDASGVPSDNPDDYFDIGGHCSGALSYATWAADIATAMSDLSHTKGINIRNTLYEDAAERQQMLACVDQLQHQWDEIAPEAYKGIPIRRRYAHYDREGLSGMIPRPDLDAVEKSLLSRDEERARPALSDWQEEELDSALESALGFEDDAMILTQELYDCFLQQAVAYEDVIDVEAEPIGPSMIGRKWIVVVDRHV